MHARHHYGALGLAGILLGTACRAGGCGEQQTSLGQGRDASWVSTSASDGTSKDGESESADGAFTDDAGWDGGDAPGDDAGPWESDASEGELDAGRRLRCPKDMVNAGGRICIDRYEGSLVDDATGDRLSPHYPPEPRVALRMFERWQEERLGIGSPQARAMPLPLLPDVEQTADFHPRAVSLRGVLPQGYISGRVAAEACLRAKKRLCTHEEWQFACRGERQTKYPYGSEYRPGVCNVFRSAHPAQKLHDNPSIGHSDPRLGLVKADDGPLLRTTGSTRECDSHWGKDSISDMVGNADEWIDDPDGTFVGGFFSRSTKEGCDSIVTVHPFTHWDYSIGFRCCR